MKTFLSPIFILLPVLLSAQSFKFQFFREQEGINNRFIYTLNQDEEGYLLIGTGEGLYRYDGLQFVAFNSSDGLADNFISCSAVGTDGKIWYGHNNGSVSYWQNGTIKSIELIDITTSRINDLVAISDGKLLVLSQNDGLIEIAQDRTFKRIPIDDNSYTFYTLYRESSGVIWIGTDLGLLRCTINEKGTLITQLIEGLPYSKITSLEMSSSGKLLIGTDDSGAYTIDLRAEIPVPEIIQIEGFDLNSFSINHLIEDESKNLWISTNFHGLFQASNFAAGKYLRVVDYNEENLIGTESIQLCFKDRESNLWIGSKGKGLIKLVDDHFALFKSSGKEDPTVYSIAAYNDNLVLGRFGHLDITTRNPNQLVRTIGIEQQVPSCPITACYFDKHGSLWVGTESNGLWVLKPNAKKLTRVTLAEDKLNQRVNQITESGEALMIATDFGIYHLVNGEIVSHLSIQSGLPHNVVRSLFTDSKGRIWVGTNSQMLSYLEDGKVKNVTLFESGGSADVKCFTEDKNGTIWCGTSGTGIIRISTKGEIDVLDKSNGLYSDFCYSVVCDHDDRIWIGHRGAMSRISDNGKHIEIFHPSSQGEIDFQDRAVIRTIGGNLLFGTDNGVLKFDPEKEIKNTFEPVLKIIGVTIADSIYSGKESITLPSGVYKVDFEFTGTSLRHPENVTFQYFLEGYDLEWSEATSDRKASYNRLEPGRYVFRVKAYNNDGIGGTTICEVSIIIKKPFWMQWWFVISTILFTLVVIRYIVYRRERFLKTNQEYLQTELQKRTLEVVEQKELLEEKNRDITASINYAKNIQRAVLPEPSILNKFFASSFVYHKPCDIVSGDFYWADRFENKILVACADCTGHGVPGAFMSLISNNLLREVSRIPNIKSPSQFLEYLDLEMRNLLTKKEGVFSVQDGMDIALIEYDTDTRILKYASANRTMFIYHQGKIIECKGDRAPLGGSLLRKSTVFSEKTYQLEEGDVIYMFSDGIVDQFGGPKGKKLKKSGLLKWIQLAAEHDMADQRSLFRSKFHEWMGDLDQLDDVLMIALRV